MQSTTHWPHAPVHQLGAGGGVFLVTAATYRKEHHFRSAMRLDVLERGLLAVAAQAGWQLEAWAVFSNHYHFVGHAPADGNGADSLRSMLSRLHVETAKWLNRIDAQRGRKVWYNFWETRLTYDRSYLARLSYVHRNAVHHGLVREPTAYQWCSAAWFERTASRAQVETVYRFDGSRLRVRDDFAPIAELDSSECGRKQGA